MELALQEGDVPKHVITAPTADMNGVSEVPKRWADHVRGQQVPQLFLLALAVATLQIDWDLGGHGDLSTQAWLPSPRLTLLLFNTLSPKHWLHRAGFQMPKLAKGIKTRVWDVVRVRPRN
jgi:hypothetical protein